MLYLQISGNLVSFQREQWNKIKNWKKVPTYTCSLLNYYLLLLKTDMKIIILIHIPWILLVEPHSMNLGSCNNYPASSGFHYTLQQTFYNYIHMFVPIPILHRYISSILYVVCGWKQNNNDFNNMVFNNIYRIIFICVKWS